MELKTAINQDVQISTFLQERCTISLNQDKDLNLYKIKQFIKCTELIQELGQIEHSCDWDLFLEFVSPNKSILVSPNGYEILEISECGNFVLVQDLDDLCYESLKEWDNKDIFDFVDFSIGNYAKLPISDISKISLKN